MPSSRNAMSKEKKREKKATVERSVQSTRIVVKMNQPFDYVSKRRKNWVQEQRPTIKNSPNSSAKAFGPAVLSSFSIWNPPGVRMMANESQKPPYEESAVAPKVLPTAISLCKIVSLVGVLEFSTRSIHTTCQLAVGPSRRIRRQCPRPGWVHSTLGCPC